MSKEASTPVGKIIVEWASTCSKLQKENTQLKDALRALYCIDSYDPRSYKSIRNRAKELLDKVK